MHTGHIPYTKLFLHDVHSIALTANGHIQVLNSSTGAVLHSTVLDTEQREKVDKSGPIVAAAVNENFTHLVTASSDKTITVREIDGLRVVSEREAPKKPTDVCFTRDGQTIITSDKFGDVHSYPLLVSSSQEDSIYVDASSNAQAVTKNAKRTSDGSLLLGHVSLLTAFLLSKDEKYIITADRDEHIRVSWYPEAYIIEQYCLGHKKFISALHVPSWDPSLLVSGGGDSMLKVWKWFEGTAVREIDIADAMMPFVKVIRQKRARADSRSDGEDGGEKGGNDVDLRQTRKKKKKAKGKGKEKAECGVAESGTDGMYVDQQVEGESTCEPRMEDVNTKDKGIEERFPPLLAVQKISTFETASTKLLVFSAHGATALFYCKFPELSDTSPLSPEVRSITFDQPILDFFVWPNQDEIWISVDGTWSEGKASNVNDANSVMVVNFVGDELVQNDDSVHRVLATSLNTTTRLEATPEMLRKLDLYSALTTLPKNVDSYNNAMDEDTPLSEAAGGQLSGKELGRLKTKRAVLAHQEALASKREHSEAPNELRGAKRQRSEGDADVK